MFDSDWLTSREFADRFGGVSHDRAHTFVARRKAFLVLLAALLAQLLLLSVQITRRGSVRLIEIWVTAAFAPVERGLHGVAQSVAGVWGTGEVLWRAGEENRQLRARLATDEIQLQELSEQAAETRRLRALLDLKARISYPTTPAEVIAWSPDPGSAVVLINRGSAEGVKKEMPVITPHGVVGKIITAYPHTAQVLLLTDPSSGAGCMLKSTRVQGVLRGKSPGLCEMLFVMDDEKVNAGDIVLTSGLDQIYPKGLLIGTVVKVQDGNIYKKIVVRPAAALDRLENVLVLQRPASEVQTRAPANRSDARPR